MKNIELNLFVVNLKQLTLFCLYIVRINCILVHLWNMRYPVINIYYTKVLPSFWVWKIYKYDFVYVKSKQTQSRIRVLLFYYTNKFFKCVVLYFFFKESEIENLYILFLFLYKYIIFFYPLCNKVLNTPRGFRVTFEICGALYKYSGPHKRFCKEDTFSILNKIIIL